VRTGEWPGYADSGMTASLPKYLTDRLRAAYEAGQLTDA